MIRKIFLYLDGSSLKSAELVCWSWRRFVLEEVWEHWETRKQVESGWRRGIPATRRLELGSACVAMCCDERSVVCGLEDGRVELINRMSMKRHKLLRGNREKVSSLDMDTRLILTGCADGTVRLWCRESCQGRF